MHILSDEEYNRVMAKGYLENPAPRPMRDEEDADLRAAYLEDPAPLPMRDEEDTDLRAVYPEDPEPAEDESWTK